MCQSRSCQVEYCYSCDGRVICKWIGEYCCCDVLNNVYVNKEKCTCDTQHLMVAVPVAMVIAAMLQVTKHTRILQVTIPLQRASTARYHLDQNQTLRPVADATGLTQQTTVLRKSVPCMNCHRHIKYEPSGPLQRGVSSGSCQQQVTIAHPLLHRRRLDGLHQRPPPLPHMPADALDLP